MKSVTALTSGSQAQPHRRSEDRSPRVTVGLPVYNGEAFLRAAIDSILGQTFDDLELVISDNASTDATGSICQQYAERDSRVRYYRNATNIGGSPNHNRVFELARGELFAWASHDDLRAPEAIARLVNELDRNPNAPACHGMVQVIEENGQQLISPSVVLDFGGKRPSERFRQLIRMDHRIESAYGLIRTAILRRTPLEGQYADSDRVLQAELGLYGPIRRVDEILLYRREHQGQSTKLYPTRQARTAWFAPAPAERIVLPHARQLWEYVRTIHRVPLPVGERLACYAALGWWILAYRRRIADDFSYALRQLFRPLASKAGILRLRHAWRRVRAAGVTK